MARRVLRNALAGGLFTILAGGMLTAVLIRYAPGFDVDERQMDHHFSEQSLEALREARGGERTPFELYTVYLRRLASGDLGESLTYGKPVREILAERAAPTLAAVGAALSLSWAIGLGLASVGLDSRWRLFPAVSNLTCSSLLCLPASAAVLLLLCLGSFSFEARVQVAAAGIALVVLPRFYLNARALLARAAAMSHVEMARARGVRELSVLFSHICQPALPGLTALAVTSIPLAIGTAIPVEVVCDSPGLGQLAWQAAQQRDWPVLLTLTSVILTITASATTLGNCLAPEQSTES